MTISIPTVHINGTSKEDLLRRVAGAHAKMHEAFQYLQLSAPHARDYYIQADVAYATAYATAAAQHEARLTAVRNVIRDLSEIWEGIDKQ